MPVQWNEPWARPEGGVRPADEAEQGGRRHRQRCGNERPGHGTANDAVPAIEVARFLGHPDPPRPQNLPPERRSVERVTRLSAQGPSSRALNRGLAGGPPGLWSRRPADSGRRRSSSLRPDSREDPSTPTARVAGDTERAPSDHHRPQHSARHVRSAPGRHDGVCGSHRRPHAVPRRPGRARACGSRGSRAKARCACRHGPPS